MSQNEPFFPTTKNVSVQKKLAHGYGILNEQAASGNDKERFAQKLIQSANGQNVEVENDPTLLKHLLEVDFGDSIPPQLFALIAEVLSLIEEIEKPHLQINDK